MYIWAHSNLEYMEIQHKHSKLGKVVSLFSGAGGMDIGFSWAGFDIVWSNDIDKDAVKTYQSIFPNHIATCGDLLSQTLPNIPDLDLVIGGPPCQGFSVAGKMDPKDPRSKHVWNFLGVVKQLNPKGFVMENVKALAVNTRWKSLLDDLIRESQRMGYNTKLFVLNSADFEVPQSRERMFLIGIKDNNNVELKPKKKKHLTVADALSSLPKFGQPGNNSICTAKITPAKSPIMRKSPYSGMLFNGQGRPLNTLAPSLTLPASMGGNRTPIIDQRELELNEEPWIKTYHNHLTKGLEPYEEAPSFLRRITVEEAAAIQTFPYGMEFKGSQSSRYRQIGNAVPPMLAYHVALAIRKAISLKTISKNIKEVNSFIKEKLIEA
jgi:DNA (cytosine-5)-methyltransferase 1